MLFKNYRWLLLSQCLSGALPDAKGGGFSRLPAVLSTLVSLVCKASATTLTVLVALSAMFSAMALTLLGGLTLALSPSTAAAAVGPTVREVVEFTRLVQPNPDDDETLKTQVSPDGAFLFIVTRKANVATDRNRFEILLFDISPGRLAALAQQGIKSRVQERTASGLGPLAAPPTSLLVMETAQDNAEADPSLREARWVGSRTIVFRARMNDEPHQAYAVDVFTRKVRQLTYAPLGVLGFDVPQDLSRVVYLTQVPNPPIEAGARALIVGAQSFWSVHGRPDDLNTQVRRHQFYLAQAGVRMTDRPLGDSFERAGDPPRVSFSPDGRWVLLPKEQTAHQVAWGKLYPRVAELNQRYGAAMVLDPLGYFSRPSSYVTRQMMLYRTRDGQARAVIEAPDDSAPGIRHRTDRLWQNGGTSVVIAGTHLPPGMSGDKATDTASHIIEYWPDSGEWKRIAALRSHLKDMLVAPGEESRFTALDGEQRRVFERLPDGRWHEAAGEPASTVVTDDPKGNGGGKSKGSVDHRGGGNADAAWRMQLRQSLNQPVDIVALGPSGQEVRLTELNPQFQAAQWGTMREYSWVDGKGRQWDGGLMMPADFKPGVPYPLVIQTYGFSSKRFYRDGANEYEGFTSGFAGRAFLREGMLVLALPWRASTDAPRDDHAAIAAFADGVRGGIDALVKEGLVDRGRIGILGWSATGVRVHNLITFSDAPIRAATVLDGDLNSLYSMTILYAANDSTQKKKEEANQGGPYGESRQRWIRNDPSLYTDCVRAALRIESYGYYAKNYSDIYALLRRQYRPVEMLKFPQGGHALSRPSERMISLQGNVDWYRFWLKGERRQELIVPTETSQSLKDQYARWEQMLAMKEAADRTPRCVRDSS